MGSPGAGQFQLSKMDSYLDESARLGARCQELGVSILRSEDPS